MRPIINTWRTIIRSPKRAPDAVHQLDRRRRHASSTAACALGRISPAQCPRGPAAFLCPPRASPQRRNVSTAPRHSLSEPTIYALSTAASRAAIAVIRISGPQALSVYHSLCPGKSAPSPRTAAVRTLYSPGQIPAPDTILDPSALVLYFPAPRTVTGEDVLELHVHGGTAIVTAVLTAIGECGKSLGSGKGEIRFAEPGEFTRRAFMNDRLDLTQVEALGDVLEASTEQQRKRSVRGTGKEVAQRYESWRKQLLYARGELEALIDFSEDQHFDESPAQLCESVAKQARELLARLQIHRENAVKGELLRNGITVSLLGAPNAGKSSLLNRIVGREAAIVSTEAGTTRDVVEVGVDLGGYLCRFGDTAGLRKNDNGVGQVEIEGMRRARERVGGSDVVVLMFSFEKDEGLKVDEEVLMTAIDLVEAGRSVVVAINKADNASNEQIQSAKAQLSALLPGSTADDTHAISCTLASTSDSRQSATNRDPGGIQALLQTLISRFRSLTSSSDPEAADSLGATERHRLLLGRCIDALQDFLAVVGSAADEMSLDPGDDGEPDMVLAAEHLRSAAECLAKITGRGEQGDVEEVLGVVFEKFCVGK